MQPISMKTRLALSMESSALPEDVEINPLTELTTNELTEALADLSDSGTEVQRQEETVDVLVDTETSMENFYRGIDALQAKYGSMNPAAAHMYHIGLEDRIRHIPIVSKDQLFLSLEAFGGSGSAEQATDASKKSLLEKLKAIWTAVYNTVQEMLKAGLQFARDLVDTGKRLEKSAMQLKAVAGKITSEAGGQVSLGRHGKQLVIAGSMPSDPTHVFAVMKQAADQVEGFTKSYQVALLPVTTMINTGNVTNEKLETATKAIAEKGVMIKPSSLDLPGNRKLVIEVDDSKLGSIDTMAQAATARIVVDKQEDPGEVQVWTKAQILAVAEQAAALARNISEVNREYRAIVEEKLTFARKGSEIVSKSTTMSSEDIAAAKKTLSKLSQITKASLGAMQPLISLAAHVNGAAINAGFICVKAHQAAGKSAE